VSAWRVSASLALRRRQWQTLSGVTILMLWIGFTPVVGKVPQGSLESACARCHPAQAAEPLTPMGRALELPGTNATLTSHPNLTLDKGAYTYTVETHAGKSTYSVTDGAHSITAPIYWSFGAEAQTWILEHNGNFYESLVSYYPSVEKLDITTGDEGLKPGTLEEAIGRRLSRTEVKACFGCHATNAVTKGQLNFGTLKPGVQCEHCHTGVETHLISEALSEGGNIESAPPALGRLNSEEISKFCGQCHRTWELVVRSGWRGVSNVRFQPYRLANSKCFNGTDHRISCLACHDPHQTVVRNEGSYDVKCLACHTASLSSGSVAHPTREKVCPVAKSRCVSCHMPKVRLPNGLMAFYDHEIRVSKPDEPYPN
jgi:hypothetical protein